MDDGGRPSVQEVKTLENLPAPAAEHFDFHHLEPLEISANRILGRAFRGHQFTTIMV